jgi:FKBP-type peptidyl-prolyl cis-trans isomerase FkpA
MLQAESITILLTILLNIFSKYLRKMCGDLRKRNNYLLITYLVLLFLLVTQPGCKNSSDRSNSNIRPGKNEMADLNRYLVQKDRERIQNYAERKNLKMVESSTGVWYQILKEGTGKSFRDGDKISMEYECTLLDGTKCYSSKTLGPKAVILGRSEMETGLNEILRILKPGAEAIIILPPFMAYGLTGDGKKIPPGAIIVYYVNILQPK